MPSAPGVYSSASKYRLFHLWASLTRHNEWSLPRQYIFIWVALILFAHKICGVLTEMPSASLGQLITGLGAVGIFQYWAWYAIFQLLISSDQKCIVRLRDLLITMALCSLLCVAPLGNIWIVASLVSVYWWIVSASDRNLRGAAIVLAALSTQELWGHVFFHLIAYPLLCAEAAIVGSILEVVRTGTVWEDNVITGPNGYGLVVYDQCSVFHNLSLAMLCWITLSQLRYPGSWRPRAFRVGVIIGLTMMSWNIVRLCLMAWNLDLYHYWHDGSGAQIFALGASLSICRLPCTGRGRSDRRYEILGSARRLCNHSHLFACGKEASHRREH